MKRRGCLNAVKVTCIWIIMVIVGLWALLKAFDPLGAIRLDTDLRRLFSGYVASPRAYALYPGEYQFTNWAAHIGKDHNRSVPDSKASDCTIAFLGDSVTFGFGVNDADTFANQIAQQLDARIINTALLGYNSVNVRLTIADTPADGYVYVVISNDDEPTHAWVNRHPTPLDLGSPDVFGVHYNGLILRFGDVQHDRARFLADLDAMRSRGNVLFVSFEAASGWYAQLPPDVIRIPFWTRAVSFIDGHPNAEGHAEIAAALMPYVSEFEARVCK